MTAFQEGADSCILRGSSCSTLFWSPVRRATLYEGTKDGPDASMLQVSRCVVFWGLPR